MGIPQAAAELLLREALRRPWGGSVLTLGRQDILFGYDWLVAAARRLGMPLAPAEIAPHRQPALAAQGFISDESFLRSLGFAETRRLDLSDFEAAEELFDLNADALPEHLRERFDLVLDSGTIEHVFHLPNALRNVCGMVKPGGRIVHLSPSSNHIDHGFYMFSPTLFWDFYTANAWEINALQLYRYTPRGQRWRLYDYRPGCLSGEVMWGGLDSAMYGVFAVVTRQAASTGDRIPQQGWYQSRWHARPDDEEPEGTKARRLLDWAGDHPRRRRLARLVIDAWRGLVRFARRWRRKGLGLRKV